MASSGAAAATVAKTADSYVVRRSILALVTVLLLTWAAVALKRAVDRSLATALPAVESISAAVILLDETPIRVTITAAWQKIEIGTTHRALLSDWTLWRRMHLENWDRVPSDLRHEALDAMLGRYQHLLTNPAAWDRMDAHDWDLVPQPIRAFAYRHMLEYWSGYYDVGATYDIPPGLMANTLAAIVMTESWFEHRAVHVNPWGNRDLGVAQASDSARERLEDLYQQGEVDVLLQDEDYFNPWFGTRFVALWMRLLLDRVDGDLSAAVRAYHRGWRRALAGEGTEYLELVRRRRHRYIRNHGSSPAWGYLWERDRALVDAAWPWIRIHGDWRTHRAATDAIIGHPGSSDAERQATRTVGDCARSVRCLDPS
jgi:hypothetical protein